MYPKIKPEKEENSIRDIVEECHTHFTHTCINLYLLWRPSDTMPPPRYSPALLFVLCEKQSMWESTVLVTG